MPTESPDEQLACVDESGRLFPLPRAEVHSRGITHLVVRVLAFDQDGEFLVQRRGWSKESCPGYFTDSASGHVSFTPGLLANLDEGLRAEAMRELEEEVGVKPIGEDPLIKSFSQPRYSESAREMSHCFVAAVEGDVVLSNEVEAIGTGFLAEEDLRALISKEIFVPVARELWLELLGGLDGRSPIDVHFPGHRVLS